MKRLGSSQVCFRVFLGTPHLKRGRLVKCVLVLVSLTLPLHKQTIEQQLHCLRKFFAIVLFVCLCVGGWARGEQGRFCKIILYLYPLQPPLVACDFTIPICLFASIKRSEKICLFYLLSKFSNFLNALQSVVAWKQALCFLRDNLLHLDFKRSISPFGRIHIETAVVSDPHDHHHQSLFLLLCFTLSPRMCVYFLYAVFLAIL